MCRQSRLGSIRCLNTVSRDNEGGFLATKDIGVLHVAMMPGLVGPSGVADVPLVVLVLRDGVPDAPMQTLLSSKRLRQSFPTAGFQE